MLKLNRRQTLGLGAAVGAGAALACLYGCSAGPSSYQGADAPRAVPFGKPFARALVMSSGGPRGFVHVGVLKALDELKWKPDLIVGSSVGALVAALCAGGYSGAELERLALDLGMMDMGRLNVMGEGRLSGEPLAQFVNARLRERVGTDRLEQLKTPVAIVCATQSKRELVALTQGNAGAAVQASAAIEGQFSPVAIEGVAHIDADLIAPLPVRLARQLGAQRVLSVDASAFENEAPPGAERFRAGDLRKRALTEPDARAADLNLQPRFGYYVSLTREFRQRAIDAGYRDTLAAASRLAAI
jgi:NTE family protein